MTGYWQDAEATAAALHDDWFRTGDLAHRDDDGFYWFAGRKKEIIVRGGSNISPQEVEAVLYEHPAVAEVAVVGHPHAVWGESVVAHVVLLPGQRLGGIRADRVRAIAVGGLQGPGDGSLSVRIAERSDWQAPAASRCARRTGRRSRRLRNLTISSFSIRF